MLFASVYSFCVTSIEKVYGSHMPHDCIGNNYTLVQTGITIHSYVQCSPYDHVNFAILHNRIKTKFGSQLIGCVIH